jgi:SOS response regulatory protein OraA/RecX
MAKLWGNKRILAEIRSKGYGEAALDAARVRVMGEDGVARCRRLLAKRRIDCMPADVKEARKVLGFLVRYGYTVTEIREAFSDN